MSTLLSKVKRGYLVIFLSRAILTLVFEAPEYIELLQTKSEYIVQSKLQPWCCVTELGIDSSCALIRWWYCTFQNSPPAKIVPLNVNSMTHSARDKIPHAVLTGAPQKPMRGTFPSSWWRVSVMAENTYPSSFCTSTGSFSLWGYKRKKDVPASTGSIAIANRKMKTWLPASRLALLAVLESGGPGWFETIDVVTLLIYQDTQLIYYAG